MKCICIIGIVAVMILLLLIARGYEKSPKTPPLPKTIICILVMLAIGTFIHMARYHRSKSKVDVEYV